MLTVMHVKEGSERIYEAQSVEFFPRPRTMHEGTEAERIQPSSVFILLPDRVDESGIHLYEGTVYVMNSSGKTVATFEIQPTPPNNLHSGSTVEGVQAYLRVDEPIGFIPDAPD